MLYRNNANNDDSPSIMNTDVQSTIQQAYARHQTRLSGLDLCKTFLELIQNLQQHRGATLAVLGGDHFFETRIQSLEPYIVGALKKIDRNRKQFVDPVEWRSLYSEWFTVQRQWRQDNAIHNFELHTHLIQEVQKQIWLVASRSGHSDHQPEHQEIARFVLLDVPQLMEAIAQLRGLATHSAAGGHCEPDFRVRLEYLNREISDQFKRMDAFLERREGVDPRQSRQRDVLFESLERWNRLKQRIEQEILDATTIEASPDATFSEASHIISHLFSLVLTGLRQLRASLDNDMRAWIFSPGYD